MAPVTILKAYDSVFGGFDTNFFNAISKILTPTIAAVANNVLAKGIDPNSIIKSILKTDAI